MDGGKGGEEGSNEEKRMGGGGRGEAPLVMWVLGWPPALPLSQANTRPTF